MASSLLALLDDIATVLDDVAVLSKAAAKKTAGVLGDDLALNAEQVTGVQAKRELPVVWAVAKGSIVNKLILVPIALALSVWLPFLITPLLMIGGAYLCYEGFEKIAEKLFYKDAHEENKRAVKQALIQSPQALMEFERKKIKGAIRTDFVLSAEIIAITLGVVGTAPFWSRVGALAFVALAITVIVYGIVAVIIKIDDVGLYFKTTASKILQKIGEGLLWVAPKIMVVLSVVGTAAMFLVGGGILVHGVSILHNWSETLPWWGQTLTQGGIGVFAGMVLVGVFHLIASLRSQPLEETVQK